MINNFNNTILIIAFNFANCLQNKEYYKLIYSSYFKEIIFYSDYPSNEDNEVNFLDISRGFYVYKIFPHFYNKYKNLIDNCDGIFYTMDDCIINVNILNNYSTSKIIYSKNILEPIETHNGWNFGSVWGKEYVYSLLNDTNFTKKYNHNTFTKQFSDYFYLPKRYLTDELFEIFNFYSIHNVFLEIAIPSIINNIETNKDNFNEFEYIAVNEENRHLVKNKDYLENLFKTNLIVHPVKFNADFITKEFIFDIFNINNFTSNTINKNINCLYLIQTKTNIPYLYQCLKKKNNIVLSYCENTEDTTIFYPNSTWTSGRNKIRDYVINLNKKYDYYIFLDDDVKFKDYTQEDGFNKFEEYLFKYKPYIANPNLTYKCSRYNIIDNIDCQTNNWFDGQFNAFCKDAFFSDYLFPYIEIFDNESWHTSQYIMILLCSIYNKQTVIFNNIYIENINHSNYPSGESAFKKAEEYIVNKISKNYQKNIILNLKNEPKEIKPIIYKKKCIIITTINEPSKQVLHYTNLNDWDLIIIGDLKTNNNLYKNINCIYLGLDEQKKMFPSLYDKIPLNSYARKMFGYLYAIKNKYCVIYDTDDDNQYIENIDSFKNNYKSCDNIDFKGSDTFSLILDNYDERKITDLLLSTNSVGFTFDKRNNELFLKYNLINKEENKNTISGITRKTKVSKKEGFVNLYKIYTDKNIWPRGIPPNHESINQDVILHDNLNNMEICIIQGLVNNDPDVDAFYRINISNEPFIFEKNTEYDIILDKYSVCPFNTQNTFWTDRTLFYAMYLPITVTFRYTDILRGFIALYQAWKHNKTIKFTFPTAIQERNEHDLNKDYESEISMYETAEQVIRLLNENKNASIKDIYNILYLNKIVLKEEINVLNEWIDLINSYN